ncbi:TRAP dicarboxylate transporter, DctM subunit [Clostridium aceticum]|uniref:TRAP dicarboxylate transporter, DctM subunit n=1 Tax=Clostridium aceticum TaxID=84022 RepID=A0A0D8I6E7_9CLOT|nr:TRAP transporter large permease [Clostridium aceticum]AKL93807.1 TRAP dicarboxylate transporter, DctM subunit [Clostridium aceticum]KJF25835.1 C4-dicarboxylate ABC transporter permease [Clostridium aceticum]
MGAIIFFSFLFFMLLGIPVAVAIGLASYVVLVKEGMPLLVMVQRMFAGTDTFPLIAVPFFILAGDLLAKGKVSEKLVDFADAIFGFLKGGLSVVCVLASMFFAAISGSGAATTAAVGTPLIPELKKKGYDEATSAALIAASGTIGVVIPPSVPMILYAVIADQSVEKLFIGGFLPGLLMGLMLITIAIRHAYKNNYPKGSPFSVKNVIKTFKEAIWGILTPVIILGGIFTGIFTPSEAAVIAVNYSLLVALFVYKDMKLKDVFDIICRSAITMSVVMFIIATSSILSWVLAYYSIPTAIANGVLSLSSNKYIIMLLITLIIVIAGVFMETASALIILTPVFLPLVREIGVDLVHFGLIIVVGLAIGMITPPVAINLYVASTVTGLPIEKITKSILPFMLGLLVVLLLLVYIPLFF